MSTDSLGPALLGPTARAETAAVAAQAADAKAMPAPAKRPRRPRPTFEDGALTRVFKFPSKTYPRSSYYVTGTEIIVRIKKARKKWKLIIPKKRVVSYRTNRWFAKPRWIALELTYTQAVKLGLVEARARGVAKNVAAHRSISPNTMSMVPITATASAIMWPRVISSSAERCTKPGARIFMRYGLLAPSLTR